MNVCKCLSVRLYVSVFECVSDCVHVFLNVCECVSVCEFV